MSTVQICLNDIFGVAVACEVIFYPGDTPFINGTALAVTGARSIRLDADGNGSVALLPGRYAVRFSGITSNTDTLLILVPNDDEVYPLSTLIYGGNWVLPMRDFLQKGRNLSDVDDAAAAFTQIKQAASATTAGVVFLATQADVDAGVNTTKCVTPAMLANAARWAQAAGAAKMVSVADAAARLALTPAQVNVFDEVEQLDTRAVYQVLDTTLLAEELGYVEIGVRPEEITLASGLMAYWNLDEEGGSRVDASGNGHDLTDNNSVGYAVGKIGYAASFDGVSNSLSNSSFSLRGLSTLSIAGWVKFRAEILPNNGAIIGIEQAGGGEGRELFIARSGGDVGAMEVALRGNSIGDVDFVTTHAMAIEQWHFVQVRLANGLLQARLGAGEWQSFAFADSIGAQSSLPLMLGAAVDPAALGSPISADMDSWGVWNRALSDTEFAELYNNGSGLSYPF